LDHSQWRVSSKGAVANQLEKQLADTLVRTEGLSFDTANELTVDSEFEEKLADTSVRMNREKKNTTGFQSEWDFATFLHRPYHPHAKFFLVGAVVTLFALIGIMYLVWRIDVLRLWRNWIKLFA
jgi:hypothetical protein